MCPKSLGPFGAVTAKLGLRAPAADLVGHQPISHHGPPDHHIQIRAKKAAAEKLLLVFARGSGVVLSLSCISYSAIA